MNWTMISTAWIAALAGFLGGCFWGASRARYNGEENEAPHGQGYADTLVAQFHRDSPR